MKIDQFIIILSIISFTGCIPKAGKGKLAEAGFEYCNKIISALEEHKEKIGRYPDTLKNLNHETLGNQPKGIQVIYDFLKKDEEPSFELSFEYVIYWKNTCHYSPKSDWDCLGYF